MDKPEGYLVFHSLIPQAGETLLAWCKTLDEAVEFAVNVRIKCGENWRAELDMIWVISAAVYYSGELWGSDEIKFEICESEFRGC